ncbi:hypothetical protein GXN76_09625 [Kroppenstedtia pulmonis]|uniref:Type I restriction modification DNA specificity domain-containing protein n=1 Tax=Kroppenstedtia pulmonis TaxID=1380685 RepID=A0A7D3Y263_9BACL|nr:restriction endonuclease subunit S [Kroppenstedtia pulmonis]QKG84703.1 hypothetical protein GXN76_09625 [Kroppenstedtia pulmonis]
MLQNNVPEGWSQMPLKEGLDRVVGGGTPSRTVLEFWSGNIPWASVKDFKDGILTINKTEEHISDKGLRNSASNLIDKGKVLVCTRMAVGRSAINTVPVAINQDIKALYTNDRLNEKFLLYFLKHVQSKMESISIGSTVKGIQVKDLLSLVIRVPSLPEQRRIAEILDTLDETIRKTEALIGKLKQVKAGLLHDLLTRGIDEHGQLRNSATHPEQFKDSPLGRIPREWRITLLIEHIDLPKGQVDPRDEPFNQWPLIAPDHIESETGRVLEYVTAEEQGAISGKYVFKSGDVLYSKIRPYLRKAAIAEGFGLCSADMYPLAPKNTIDSYFLLLVILGEHFSRYADACSGRTGIPKLNREELSQFKVALPPIEEQKRIVSVAHLQDKRIQKEQSYLNKLQQLKKGLMEDLLTGKVRVNQLEEVQA